MITAGINMCKSVIKKKIKKHGKTILLPKDKLGTREFLIAKALVDSDITHEEFVSVKILKEYDFDIKRKH